jgi:hypothetical protein
MLAGATATMRHPSLRPQVTVREAVSTMTVLVLTRLPARAFLMAQAQPAE